MAHSDQTTRICLLVTFCTCTLYVWITNQGMGKETLKLAGRRVKNDELVFSNPWITHISN